MVRETVLYINGFINKMDIIMFDKGAVFFSRFSFFFDR